MFGPAVTEMTISPFASAWMPVSRVTLLVLLAVSSRAKSELAPVAVYMVSRLSETPMRDPKNIKS